MRQIFRLEMKRVFSSKEFWLVLGVGLLFILAHLFGKEGILADSEFNRSIEGVNGIEPHSVWYSWLGLSPGTENYLYFSLAPLLAAIPYAASGWKDIKSGYQKQMVMRVPRKTYFLAKYAAVFLSGGIVITVPLLLDFLLCHCFLPAYRPLAAYGLSIVTDAVGSELFYTHPYLYVFLFLFFIDFLFGGAYACLGLSATYLLENSVLIQFFPYIVQTILVFLCDLCPFPVWPFLVNKMNPYQPYAESVGAEHYLIHLLLFIGVSFAVYLRRGKYREIYR